MSFHLSPVCYFLNKQRQIGINNKLGHRGLRQVWIPLSRSHIEEGFKIISTIFEGKGE
jgi:hypothetical protein